MLLKRDQLFAEIVCPGTSRTYDFVLSSSISIGMIKELIVKEIAAMEGTDNFYGNADETELFSSEYQLPLSPEKTLGDYGLRSGCRLMLI